VSNGPVEYDIDLALDKDDDYVPKIINALKERFGRIPTEDEVMMMICGNPEERLALWNKEI
jgi:hypothetical protein